ncbi:MAG: hypothetical protein JXB60_03565 [Candidatus Cloacimonetes bacterium]|nr:hypothetical protein [Candidatus Cloacimonadota bacterium]
MDILSHSLWSLALLPGPPVFSKVVMGLLPDLSVFGTGLVVQTIKGQKQPRFQSREQMLQWFDKKDNRWIKGLYSWTHSLIIWICILIPVIIIYRCSYRAMPWFMLAAPLHIIMDIPTHTRDSFPVRFLTPLSRFQINGIHWSRKNAMILNYSFLLVTLAVRIGIIRQ